MMMAENLGLWGLLLDAGAPVLWRIYRPELTFLSLHSISSFPLRSNIYHHVQLQGQNPPCEKIFY